MLPVGAWAQSQPLLIVGIQTGGASNASQERIKLANTTAVSIDLAPYRLQYFAAQPKDMQKPARMIALSGKVAAGDIFTLGTEGEANVDQRYAATLAAGGGHLRLMRGDSVVDLVGWGTAAHAQGRPAPAPAAGQLLSRNYDSQSNTYNASGNNADDFGQLPEPVVRQSSAIRLTELLPDPAHPATDAADEFVEIHNTGSEAVDLTGYQLSAGVKSTRNFTLQDTIIAPGEYQALFSAQTKLTLGNAGSTVKLLDANGVMLDEVSYQTALAGQAYALDGQAWQWTTTPTPNQSNNIQTPPFDAKTSKATKANTKKATKAKTAKTAKKTNAKAAATKKAAQQASQKEQIKPPLHTGVVAGVGGAAVLYGAYEYRQDAFNLYRKLRGDRKVR